MSGIRTLPFRVHKYECRENIGGNMSEVYLGFDPRAERFVVIKLLKNEDCDNEDVRERFLQEGRLACRCSHANVITTYETDEENGQPYIVMERLQGQNLRSLLSAGGKSHEELIGIAMQIASGMQYIHTLGILHRDIKPTNINVSDDGIVKIFDFGIARIDGTGLTRVGDVIGTPRYMAPEQILGRKATTAVDIYSFGVLLFEMFGYQMPYEGSTLEELTVAIVHAPPNIELLRQRQVPERIVKLVEWCLQKSPEARPASFDVVCRALRGALQPESPTLSQPAPAPGLKPANWKLWWSLLVVLLAGIGVAAFLLLRPKPVFPPVTPTTSPTAPQATQQPTSAPNVPLGMLLVPGGEALLGERKTPKTIAGFYIDKTEVPVSDYLRFCRERSITPPPEIAAMQPDLPVTNVSYNDALEFAKWAGKRLPSADEWEAAARGSQGLAFPWGNDFKPGLANIRLGKAGVLEPVDSNPAGASPSGALNMLGNAWELLNTPAQAPPGKQFEIYRKSEFNTLNPPLTPDESYVQIRGGSYLFPVPKNQIAALIWDELPFPARARKPDVGFRCARDLAH